MSSTPRHKAEENDFMINTLEFLNEERENVLSEVLKCYVCLELPKSKQVRICEKGHHFCLSCHGQMKVCGICRSNLLDGRNFVVEQLVERLGVLLEIPNSQLPPAEPPVCLRPGSYQCPHDCPRQMPAFQVLPHLRAKHSTHLVENVRSNPYTGRFSFTYDILFYQDKKHIWSVYVSDMGLFTVDLRFFHLDFFGCIRILGDESTSSQFEQQLVVRVPRRNLESFFEFSLTDCPVSSYRDDMEFSRSQGSVLSIKESDLLEHIDPGSPMTIFFSVWKKSDRRKKLSTSVACAPERHLFFKNDRKTRRNRNRNMRRKRVIANLRSELEELSEKLSGTVL